MREMLPPPTLDENDVEKTLARSCGDPDDADAGLIDQWAKDVSRAFHRVKMGFIYCVPILGLICILIYFWHATAPGGWRWLPAEDLKDLRSTAVSILSGVISSIAVGYFYRK